MDGYVENAIYREKKWGLTKSKMSKKKKKKS
jgi:hypothetical protein